MASSGSSCRAALTWARQRLLGYLRSSTRLMHCLLPPVPCPLKHKQILATHPTTSFLFSSCFGAWDRAPSTFSSERVTSPAHRDRSCWAITSCFTNVSSPSLVANTRVGSLATTRLPFFFRLCGSQQTRASAALADTPASVDVCSISRELEHTSLLERPEFLRVEETLEGLLIPEALTPAYEPDADRHPVLHRGIVASRSLTDPATTLP